MKYRRMGNSGLKISEIGLGTWIFGDSVSKEDSIKCLETAFEHGINFIDTADIYANGKSEEIIGEFFANETISRRDLVISSKVYWAFDEGVNNFGAGRKHIMESIDDTLDRLQLDNLDLYFIHSYDRDTELEETTGAMHDLITSRKTHYWGTSGCLPWQIEKIMRVTRENHTYAPKVEQPRYNLQDRYIELEIMETCEKNGMGIVAWSPLHYGILTGKYTNAVPKGSRLDRGNEEENKAFLKRNAEMIENARKLSEIAKELDISSSQLSLAFILRRKEMTSAIIGASKPEHIIDNVKSPDVELSDDILNRIDDIYQNVPEFVNAHDGGPKDFWGKFE